MHSNTGLPKKDRNISNKQPNPTYIYKNLRGEENNKAQREQKEGNNQDQSRLNDIETKIIIKRIYKSNRWFFKKISKINKPISRIFKKKREHPNKQNKK